MEARAIEAAPVAARSGASLHVGCAFNTGRTARDRVCRCVCVLARMGGMTVHDALDLDSELRSGVGDDTGVLPGNRLSIANSSPSDEKPIGFENLNVTVITISLNVNRRLGQFSLS